MDKKKIVILGGGFGGIYAAMHLQKHLKGNGEYEIVIINRENYFVYQPMLAEVVGGTVGITDTISSLRSLIPKAKLYIREIEYVDTEKKIVVLTPKFSQKSREIKYDHLVVALGNITDFSSATGLHEHAMPFKNLADALTIRNHVIETVEAAAYTNDPEMKKMLLTYVVGGGGFSGTEVVAELNDLVHRMAKSYPNIHQDEIRVMLVHSKDRLMDKELSESLGTYAGKLLQKRGVEVRFNTRLISASPKGALLDTKEKILSKTVISTVPSSPNPIVASLPFPQEHGKLKTNATMQVEGSKDVWAVGDCALIPDLTKSEGKYCPPTAQYAVREGKVLAQNILSTIHNAPLKEFRFKNLGSLGALGHNSAVGEFFGCIKVSGLIGWFMWRTIYWSKLPGFGRKIKVAATWFLDMIVSAEPVQLKIAASQGISSLHFESGEEIFHQGDVGDYLYIIVKGKVDVLQEKDGKENAIAELGEGEFFGEMSLLNERARTATIKCKEPVDVLAIRKQDFGVLIANFSEMREKVLETEEKRKKA